MDFFFHSQNVVNREIVQSGPNTAYVVFATQPAHTVNPAAVPKPPRKSSKTTYVRRRRGLHESYRKPERLCQQRFLSTPLRQPLWCP